MTSQAQPSEPTGVESVDVVDLDVKGTLAAAALAMDQKHAAEVLALEVDLQFAALHSEDPQAGRAPRPRLAELKGSGMTLAEWDAAGNKLIALGGDGAPMVQDLPLCELATARGVHVHSARSHLAAALDLSYRLPSIWSAVRTGKGEVWVAIKVAAMSRHLNRVQIRQVDAAVATAMDESPGRLLTIAEAAILRADPEHARQAEAERRRRRCLVIGRSDEDGLRKVFGLINAGDAAWLDAMIERVADTLHGRPDLLDIDPETITRDELRAEAVGWLAHPEDVIDLLKGTYSVDGPDNEDPAEATPTRSTKQRATVYVHLSQAAVEAFLHRRGTDLVARVEDLGPMLADQLRRLLGHAHVTVKPVIDLNTGRSVNQYEHPADVQERSFLRATGDVFPHAQTQSRHFDGDHPVPYDSHGPPGQTGDHNHAPLGRGHHRAKTHLPYQVHQIDLGVYLWRTPHGLWRLVDGTGTHPVDEQTALTLLARR